MLAGAARLITKPEIKKHRRAQKEVVKEPKAVEYVGKLSLSN